MDKSNEIVLCSLQLVAKSSEQIKEVRRALLDLSQRINEMLVRLDEGDDPARALITHIRDEARG